MQGPAGLWRTLGHERLTEKRQAAFAEWSAAAVLQARGHDLAAVGAVARRSAAACRSSGAETAVSAGVSGRDPLFALHGDAVRRSAARARLSERGDLPAQVARVERSWCLAAGADDPDPRARHGRQARLVTDRRRRVD